MLSFIIDFFLCPAGITDCILQNEHFKHEDRIKWRLTYFILFIPLPYLLWKGECRSQGS